MKSLYLFLFVSILLIPYIQAVSMNATNITSTGLNTTFYINRITSFSVLTVHSSYINFSNLVYTHPLSSEGNITIQKLNISNSNKRFTISSLPYFTSSSTSTLKKIASNLSQAINATVTFNVTGCNINSITYTSDNGDGYNVANQPGYTCNSATKRVTVDLYDIEPASSSNNIAITYSSAQPTGQSGGPQGTATTISNQTNTTQEIQPKDLTKRDNSLSINKPIIIYIILGVIIIIAIASYLSRNQLKKLVKKS